MQVNLIGSYILHLRKIKIILSECQSLGSPVAQSNGVLSITRDSLVALLQKTSKSSIDNYVSLTSQCHNGRQRSLNYRSFLKFANRKKASKVNSNLFKTRFPRHGPLTRTLSAWQFRGHMPW